jgi:potassium-transporting ATPase KdpC subunit
MLKQLKIAILFTIVTTILCGILYPLAVTGAANLLFPNPANGSLVTANGKTVGSKLIGQPFTSPLYFHPRPSAAGSGYDAIASGSSNLGPTNHALADRINSDAAALRAENPDTPIPADLLTTSASGLDPDISPDAAYFQIPRIAKARSLSEPDVRALVQAHITPRQFGFLGEPRINVLELNLALDAAYPRR